MTAPPGTTPTTEPLPGNQAGVGHRPLTPKRKALRWLMTELGITGPQAKQLIAAYERDRAADARRAAREEFSAWFQRRGDLLVVRGKIKHAWRVTS